MIGETLARTLCPGRLGLNWKLLKMFFSLIRPLQTASRWRRCLAMLACAYIHGMSMGTTIGLSVMYAELIAVFSATRSQVALIQSLYVGLLSGGGNNNDSNNNIHNKGFI